MAIAYKNLEQTLNTGAERSRSAHSRSGARSHNPDSRLRLAARHANIGRKEPGEFGGAVYVANPHAMTSVGGTSYTCDNNGNVTAIGCPDYTWNWRNRLVNAERSREGSRSTATIYNCLM